MLPPIGTEWTIGRINDASPGLWFFYLQIELLTHLTHHRPWKRLPLQWMTTQGVGPQSRKGVFVKGAALKKQVAILIKQKEAEGTMQGQAFGPPLDIAYLMT